MSRDFLALISGRDIRVASTQVTGAGDLHIHAALFAHRRFCIDSVDRGKVGRLLILGSLTAGTIVETEPRYATKLDYDKRFEYLRPANFPMTRRYEVDSWDQDWEEVEGARHPKPRTGPRTLGIGIPRAPFSAYIARPQRLAREPLSRASTPEQSMSEPNSVPSFSELGLSERRRRRTRRRRLRNAHPIQAQTIPASC